jgi:transporter family protein
MLNTLSSWFFWAALSACFAALTAIFAKIGIQGVDSHFATLIRTVIIVFVLAAFVWYANKGSDPRTLPANTVIFLALSALATGASWVCYFRALQVGDASKVAPVTSSAWCSSPCSLSRFSANVPPHRSGWVSALWRAACWSWHSTGSLKCRGLTEIASTTLSRSVLALLLNSRFRPIASSAIPGISPCHGITAGSPSALHFALARSAA